MNIFLSREGGQSFVPIIDRYSQESRRGLARSLSYVMYVNLNLNSGTFNLCEQESPGLEGGWSFGSFPY